MNNFDLNQTISYIREKEFKRVLILGLPGSGKTTLAKEIEANLNQEHIEVDKILWSRQKGGKTDPNFEKRMKTIFYREHWVIEGQIKRLFPIVKDTGIYPDVIIKMSTPLRTVLLRLLVRDAKRLAKSEQKSSDFLWALRMLLKRDKIREKIEFELMQKAKGAIYYSSSSGTSTPK